MAREAKLTKEEILLAKEYFEENGICMTVWTKNHKISYRVFIDVMRGRLKGIRGESFKVVKTLKNNIPALAA